MRVLELRVPPVALAVFVLGLMWVASWAFPSRGFHFPSRGFAWASLAGAGLMAGTLGVVACRRIRTTVNPLRPDASSSLVVSGVYTFTRNPMYLGLLLVLAGWSVFLSNAIAVLFLPTFFFYMNRFQIEPEERVLASKFGQEFGPYKSRVRRWV